jgi:hypothetical protein
MHRTALSGLDKVRFLSPRVDFVRPVFEKQLARGHRFENAAHVERDKDLGARRDPADSTKFVTRLEGIRD